MDNANTNPNEGDGKITEFLGIGLNKRVIEKLT